MTKQRVDILGLYASEVPIGAVMTFYAKSERALYENGLLASGGEALKR